MLPFCEYFVKRGFVVASIQYRLLAAFPTQSAFTAAAFKAVSDMKGAYRFFKSDAANANSYKVDTTKIFVGDFQPALLLLCMPLILIQTITLNPTSEHLSWQMAALKEIPGMQRIKHI